MKKLLFATNNPHKVREVRDILRGSYQILSLEEAGIQADLPETGITLWDNAIQKATHIQQNYGLDCFSEDTGLEVDALSGAPGVHTARYAGPEADARANMAKLLDAMQDTAERSARFRTVIALYMNDELLTFEGVIEGHIALGATGSGGFGYDPIFIPTGYDASFAVLSPEVKSQISHRAKAMGKLVMHLTNR